MNPKQFLLIGGVVLLLLGVLGYLLPDPLLGNALWLTGGENITHVVLGIVAIVAAYALGHMAQKWLTIIVGLVALYFGVAGFFLAQTAPPALNYYNVANLELLDNLIHLVVAIWAFMAAKGAKHDMMGSPSNA
ncbi:MAG: hypothetical protein HYS59_00635 [Candidatus Vogelbacteria bacterium]|nr:hypothetical protein [Candidatus Vogelbacteria bacterium]